MKIPVFECFCGNCGQSRVVALNGSKAPERCPGCGSPERFKIKFLEPESLTMPDIGKRNAPLPGRLTVMKTPPVIQKFEAIVSGIAVNGRPGGFRSYQRHGNTERKMLCKR